VIPKIVGGYTPACLQRALSVYGRAIKTLVPVESCRVAEAVKLTCPLLEVLMLPTVMSPLLLVTLASVLGVEMRSSVTVPVCVMLMLLDPACTSRCEAAVRTDTPRMTPLLGGRNGNLHHNLVHAVQGGDVDITMVRGRILVDDGKLVSGDLQQAIAEANRVVPDLFKRRAAWLASNQAVHRGDSIPGA
jgi:hypothetical protein